MLQKLSEHIAGCLQRAAEADARAVEAADPIMKRDLQEIAATWRHLAASYQFAEALERFVLDIDRAKRLPPTAP